MLSFLAPTQRLLCILVLTAVMPAYPAFAGASHLKTPLMVVRFNQARVYYQQPLFNAVKQAFAAKPGVQFAIVSLVPAGADKASGEQAASRARENASGLIQAMQGMGVPQSRISVQYRVQNNITADEAHIFVR